MPTIHLNKKEVLKLVGRKVSDQQLKEHISFLGTDLEDITKDEILVEIFPNRPDMLSDQGFARALKAFMGFSKKQASYPVQKSPYVLHVDHSVKKVRPFTACAVVKGLPLTQTKIEEIIQIQEKLHITYGRNRKKAAIGIYPLDKISWPITYVAKKPESISFTPLDTSKIMTGRQILEAHPTGKEYGHLLEGAEVFPLFVDAKGNILSMPPIINSDDVGKLDEKTRDVFIECSGSDLGYLETCLNMIVTALADMGGVIHAVTLRYGSKKIATPNLQPRPLPFKAQDVKHRLGLQLKQKDIIRLLAKMGIGYKAGKAFVPAYRADILHPVDLTEDIAIAYGYNKIPSVVPDVYTEGAEDPYDLFMHRIRLICIGLGLIETKQYNLVSKEEQLSRMGTDMPIVTLGNSLSEEWGTLRAWVLPTLFKTLQTNKGNEYPQHLFEIGHVFVKKETGMREMDRLGIVLCGQETDFTQTKQMLDAIFRSLGLAYHVQPSEHPSFIPGRVGRVGCQGRNLAYVGEIHPKVITNWELGMPVAAMELNLTELFSIVKESLKKY